MAFAKATTLGYLALKIDTRTWFTQIEPMTIYSESESAIIALREKPQMSLKKETCRHPISFHKRTIS